MDGAKSDPKDDDSIVSDRCWEENYRGDSRKWLMRDGTWKFCDPTPVSTMRDTFQPPKIQLDTPNMGIRDQSLLKRFYEEAAAEVISETEKPYPVEEYCTEYDGNYHIPGFKPDDNQHYKQVELYEKYPLYSSESMSFWRFQLNDKPRPANLPGLTQAFCKQDPFKRHSRFTKPISEVLDEEPN